jgi:uncharacterized protein (TIGR03000 family)
MHASNQGRGTPTTSHFGWHGSPSHGNSGGQHGYAGHEHPGWRHHPDPEPRHPGRPHHPDPDHKHPDHKHPDHKHPDRKPGHREPIPCVWKHCPYTGKDHGGWQFSSYEHSNWQFAFQYGSAFSGWQSSSLGAQLNAAADASGSGGGGGSGSGGGGSAPSPSPVDNPYVPPPVASTEGTDLSRGDTPGSSLATAAQEVMADNRAAIGVRVSDPRADVRLDGTLIPATGTERLIVTPVLEPRKSYRCQVSVSWNKDGQRVASVREVTVVAGEFVLVDFRQAEAAPLASGR